MNKKLTTAELNRPELEDYLKAEKFPVVVLLDDIRSLSNVGSIFRTSDAFKVEEVILCGITGRPPHREIQRTALGATESVAWRYEESAVSCLRDLKNNGYHILALEQCEDPVQMDEWTGDEDKRYCLIVGNEVNGVNQELIDLSDEILEIPQLGTKHSLNVTVATGIALWEIFKVFKK